MEALSEDEVIVEDNLAELPIVVVVDLLSAGALTVLRTPPYLPFFFLAASAASFFKRSLSSFFIL